MIEKEVGIPAPAPLVLKNRFWARVSMRTQRILIAISRRMFAYQMLMVVRPLPTVDTLLGAAHRHTEKKAAELVAVESV